MVSFSFGAPTAPTPASAASTSAPTGGGLTFGTSTTPAPALTDPATTTTAAAANNSAQSGFSFGAPTSTNTASTSTSTSPSAAGGGFSFGAPSSSSSSTVATVPPNTTNTVANANVSDTNPNTTQIGTAVTNAVAPPPTATATVPTFEDSFPFLAIHSQLEHLLNSIHDYHSTYLSSDNDGNESNNNVSDDSTETDLLLQGQELCFLLSSMNESSLSLSSSSYGQLLSNPTKALQSIWKNTANNNYNSNNVPNIALRQQLLSNPVLQFPTPDSSSTSNANTTIVPPSMLNSIFKLSDWLQISEVDAASLYGVILSAASDVGGGGSRTGAGVGIKSVVNDNNKCCNSSTFSDTGYSAPLERHIIGLSTLKWFQDRHTRPNLIGGFLEEVVQRAKENRTYVPSNESTGTNNSGQHGVQNQYQYQNNTNEQYHQQQQQNQQQQQQYQSGSTTNDDGLLKLAMDLYFTERSSCLQTLLLLIQHRVSVYSSSAASFATPSSANQQLPLPTRIILESTDQLLQSNLISNLIALIRELTKKNEEIEKKICVALDQYDRSSQQNQKQQQQQQGVLGSSTSGFGGFSPSVSTPQSPGLFNNNNVTQSHDVDYAMYEFTFRQRQLAAECLFYLTYHTQCTPTEVAALIDIVQDLTNGSNGTTNGIGSGLPTLDAIRDVPDPYTLSWGNDGENGNGTSADDDHHAMQGVKMTSSAATPQQRKLEKAQVDWEDELVSSLWSVRGLANATITTAHTDFSGHRIYHATPLGAIGNDVGDFAVAVGGGKPQLLQCVSTLILSVVCSLDARNTLIDRSIHRPNDFGSGNALFPPKLAISSPTEVHVNLVPINDRLDPNSGRYSNWKRQDIGGLMSAAYALLLWPSTNIFTSPQKSPRERSSSSGSTSNNTVHHIFRSCLEIPTMTKSFTFARLSLIAGMGMPSMKSSSTILDNDFSFYISVLTDFTSQFLDAISSFSDLPISRTKWMDNELQELQVRHVQEHQRRQLNSWSGQSYQEVDVPTEVDIFKRPDCLDDIIALAVSVCASCPECANRFWSTNERLVESTGDGIKTDEYIIELKPSRILKKLEKIQAKDSSLLPVYLSFLGAIGLYESPDQEQRSMNGALAVHEWLSDANRLTSSPSSLAEETKISWEYILNEIRWYTQQLNPSEEENTDDWSSGGRYNQSYSQESTGYYYGTNNNSGYNDRSQNNASSKVSASRSARHAKKELDEASSRTLSSLLTILSQVAFKSDVARRSILDIRLAVPGMNRRYLPVEDDALTILFSLLVTSISSELRGSALCAISNLVRCTEPAVATKEQQSRDNDVVRRCWNLLELSQLIPIDKLCQYSPMSTNISSHSHFTRQENWFPSSEQYGILYEMEYIECKNGSYPATEGLLKLLSALFSSSSLPSDLGSGRRAMLGCNPYIEYVVDFVLPRATKKGRGALYFNTPADKSRLWTRALEVVNAVLVRYIIPHPGENNQQIEPNLVPENRLLLNATNATSLIKNRNDSETESFVEKPDTLSLVNKYIFALQNTEVTVQDVEYDFADIVAQSCSTGGNQDEAIPQVKSPGFYILADLLSPDSELLNILLLILTDNLRFGGRSGNLNDANLKAKALFVEIKPQFSTAKAARDYLIEQQRQELNQIQVSSIRSHNIENLMSPLYPPNVQELPKTSSTSLSTTVTDSDDTVWKEHCALLGLRIICAAAGRDNAFRRRIDMSKTSSRLVPVMRFRPRDRSMLPLFVKDIRVRRFSKQIIEMKSILPLLIQYIGYQPTSFVNDSIMAAAAMSILNYLSANVPTIEYSRCINGMNGMERTGVAVAFSTRLSLTSASKEADGNVAISESILNHVAACFRHDTISDEDLSFIILGFSSKTIADKKRYLLRLSQGIDIELCESGNVLDTMISLISDMNVLLEPSLSPLASKCFEIIYRICDNETPSFQLTKFCVMSKLRRVGFWQTQMLRFLGKPESSNSLLSLILTNSPIQRECGLEESPVVKRDSSIMHCVSWILKGVSLELYALMGHSISRGTRNKLDVSVLNAMSPQPTKCRQLLRLLFRDAILVEALKCLPIEKPPMAEKLFANAPNRDIVESATCNMKGPIDICGGYKVIITDKLLLGINEYYIDKELAEAQKFAAIEWANNWNSYIKFSCASSHLCQSWYFLSQTVLTLCRPVLFSKDIKEGAIFDERFVLEFLKLTLSRLNSQGRRGSTDTSSNAFSITVYQKEEFEAANIYHLSALCFLLVEFLLERQIMVEDDAREIMLLLIGAIASCEECGVVEDVSNSKRAAELCCAMTALLESKIVDGSNLLFGSSSFQIRSQILKAASYLAKLSALSATEVATQDNSLKYISYVARSGLISLLSWYDQQESLSASGGQGHFLVELFAPQAGIVARLQPNENVISYYLTLLEKFDDGIMDLLQCIASCNRGTELLVNHGISQVLVSISRNFFDGTKTNRTTSSYGSIGIEIPDFVLWHFLLFNAMLSSASPRTVRLQLISDAVCFLQIHSQNYERLFSGYPLNKELITNVVTTLCQLPAIGDSDDMNTDMSFRSSGWYLNLERNIFDLGFHLAIYPLPCRFLTRLPASLRVAQFHHQKNLNIHNQLEKCWWDAVESEDNEIIVPDPVFKASSVGMAVQVEISDWSISKYESAYSAAKFLDLCLLYLTKAKEADIAAYALSIASAISRCSTTKKMTTTRLAKLKADGERQLPSMFSHLMDSDSDFARVNQINEIEKEVLETYETVLSSCLEKLLYLAEKIQNLALKDNAVSSRENATFISQAVNSCDLETSTPISFSDLLVRQITTISERI